jgi:hypothetical protein
MYDEASQILEYLPIRRSPIDDEYINYLWNSFGVLVNEETENVSSFSLLPFHLLFMLAVHYKVLRYAETFPNEYRNAFTFVRLREGQEKVLRPNSVFDMSVLGEREVFNVFQLIGLSEDSVRKCKKIIDTRNANLMHANGKIVHEVEETIQNYCECLSNIQTCFTDMNERIAEEWRGELDESEDVKEFVDVRLYSARLCVNDFRSGTLRDVFGEHVSGAV